MWERFAYYGMRALIVLYMIQSMKYSAEMAGNIYGLYTGLVYLTPLIGGYLADRYFGQRKCITAGAIFMIIGLGLLSSGIHGLFLPALFFMICSNGFIKSNISSVLGLLYGENEDKKDSAFTVFYMGINLGAFMSPLICGTIAVKYGFQYGFAAAGIGMCIGLLIYKVFENSLLLHYGLNPVKINNTASNNDDKYLNKTQSERIRALFLLMIFTIPFWICFEQAGSSLTLFAEYDVNRNFLGFEIPTGYFQSFNPLFIITLAPLMSIFWDKLKHKSKEPSSVEKFAIALALISLSYVVLTIAGYFSINSKVSPVWLIIAYFIMTIAELCLSPIGLSLVSKLAPKQFLSLIMGTWFLTSFLGNLISGFWGGKYGSMQNSTFFAILAMFSFATFILLLFFTPKLNNILNLSDE